MRRSTSSSRRRSTNWCPKAPLGGPAFEGTPGDVDSWADANGRVSFLGRFVDYLKARGRLQDFTFFSFEHYPCMGGRRCAEWSSLYEEPAYVNHVIQAWKDNGLPPNVPFFMTEGNDLGEGGTGHRQERALAGRLCRRHDDRGRRRHLLFPLHRHPAPEAAAAAFLPIDENNHVRYYPPQYLAAQVITKEWVQPVDAMHKLFKVASDVKDQHGNILVTAYAVERPDGQWSVMLVNKDQDNDHSVKVAFADAPGRNRFFDGDRGPGGLRSGAVSVASRSCRSRSSRDGRRWPRNDEGPSGSGRARVQIGGYRRGTGYAVPVAESLDYRAAGQVVEVSKCRGESRGHNVGRHLLHSPYARTPLVADPRRVSRSPAPP